MGGHRTILTNETIMQAKTRTAIIVGSSAALAIIGDVLTYSLGASKGGKFRLAFPKGKDIIGFLAIGIISGFAVDFVIKAISARVKSEEEKKLDALLEEAIILAETENKKPVKIIWS